MESTAFRPVCRGVVTGWRNTTPGALRSRGSRMRSPSIGPLPSIGSPSMLMTRPNSPSPTGMEATSPVRFTDMFSVMLFTRSSNTTPTLLSSRLRATPFAPFSNSTSSLLRTFSRPYTCATPSPAVSTVPTSSNLTFELMFSSSCFSTSDISLGLSMLIVTC